MRIVAFDTETTGTDPEKDRIIEICLLPAGGPAETFRVNPGVPIPAGASAVHGISDADVQDLPSFRDIAPKVQALVEGAVLLGYNSRNFDTLLVDAELRRAGQPGIDLDSVREIDVLRLWQELEPRTLSGAAKRWLGSEHAGAHGAVADVEMTLAVWQRIAETFELDHDACIEKTRPANELDRAGRFRLDAEGHVVFNFGKHHGTRVNAVDAGYLAWMMRGEFPTSTKSIVSRLIEHDGDLPEAKAYRARLTQRPS